MSKPRLTVGSLRGIPQRGVARLPRAPLPPPVKLGRGCCRSMCAGCPWAEAVRRQQRAQLP